MHDVQTEAQLALQAGFWVEATTREVLYAHIEALNANQLRMRDEFGRMLDALRSQTMTKEQISEKLETIRNELAIPKEDMSNLAWVRKYLTHASQTGGKGL